MESQEVDDVTEATKGHPQRVYVSPSIDRKWTLTERTVAKTITQPFWDAWAAFVDTTEKLSDKRLWQLREAVEAMGRTNCGWLEYRMRGDFLHHIEWEIKRREAGRHAK
jgi:hypothetical protein